MANRSHGKIDKLRPEVKSEVESMITSNNFTYKEIVDYIRDSTGEMISQASVCRYARRLCESLDSHHRGHYAYRVPHTADQYPASLR